MFSGNVISCLQLKICHVYLILFMAKDNHFYGKDKVDSVVGIFVDDVTKI